MVIVVMLVMILMVLQLGFLLNRKNIISWLTFKLGQFSGLFVWIVLSVCLESPDYLPYTLSWSTIATYRKPPSNGKHLFYSQDQVGQGWKIVEFEQWSNSSLIMVMVVLVMVMAMVVAFDRPSANGSLMAATTECANRPAETVPNGIASHANRTLLWYLSQVKFYYCTLSVCNVVQLYWYLQTKDKGVHHWTLEQSMPVFTVLYVNVKLRL